MSNRYVNYYISLFCLSHINVCQSFPCFVLLPLVLLPPKQKHNFWKISVTYKGTRIFRSFNILTYGSAVCYRSK